MIIFHNFNFLLFYNNYQLTTNEKNYHQNIQVQVDKLSHDGNNLHMYKPSELKKINFVFTVMTMMKMIMGIGIIGLPYVFSQLGWALAIFIFGLTTILNQFSCMILLKIKNLSGRSNYSTILFQLTQSKLSLIVFYSIFILSNMGTCITQLTVFKTVVIAMFKVVYSGFQNHWYIRTWFLPQICLGFLLLPLVLQKKIQRLKFLAMTGIILLLIFLICVVINFFHVMISRDWKFAEGFQAFPKNHNPYSVIASLPSILYAYCFQYNFFPLFKGLQGATDKKMRNVTFTGLLGCFILFSFIGIICYATYGSTLQTNFLASINYNDTPHTLFYIMNGIYACSILCSFPLVFFFQRNCFIALIKLIRQFKKENQSKYNKLQSVNSQNQLIKCSNYQQEERKFNSKVFMVQTIVCLSITITASLLLTSIKIVFNVLGAISANSFIIGLPTFYYMGFIRKYNHKKTVLYRISSMLLVFSIGFAVFSITCLFIK